MGRRRSRSIKSRKKGKSSSTSFNASSIRLSSNKDAKDEKVRKKAKEDTKQVAEKAEEDRKRTEEKQKIEADRLKRAAKLEEKDAKKASKQAETDAKKASKSLTKKSWIFLLYMCVADTFFVFFSGRQLFSVRISDSYKIP